MVPRRQRRTLGRGSVHPALERGENLVERALAHERGGLGGELFDEGFDVGLAGGGHAASR
jgi:hypothetical protein